MAWLWIVVLLLGVALLAHLGVPAIASLTIVALYLVAMGVSENVPAGLMVLFWLLWAVVAVFLLATDLRRRYFSAPMFEWFKTVLPPISATERDAIDAGTVWWDGELFSGRPDWRRLLDYPRPRLTEEEQAFLDGPTETLCAMVSEWDIAQRMDLPAHAWDYIKAQGFFALIIPKAYGGKGFSAFAHSQVVMKLATRSNDLASTVMVPNSLGPAELLLRYGTDRQREHYLPRLADGRDIPCFALTGPYAGSDAGAMNDTGVVCRGQWLGEDVIGLRLNWEKRYITLGPVATLLGVAFKTYDPDHLLGDETDLGISLALIPTDTVGVDIGRRHLPLGAAFMNGPNWGKDVFVPLDAVIGGREMLGKGWMMLMNCLSVGRSISLPATGTSAAKLCSYVSGRYAHVREQFNVPLERFEGIQAPLARIGGNAWLMDGARSLTALAVDLGERPSVLSAILKYHLTERGRECISHAMDIHGGKGIMLGPNNYLARSWLSAPISITVEGANILSRNLMIFGQGAIRCHPFVLREMETLLEPDHEQAIARFDKVLLEHIGFAVRNAASTLILSLSLGLLGRAPGDATAQPYFRALDRLAAAFAMLADLSMMLLGGELKRRERLSARLGDVLSYLYLGSAALKQYHDAGHPEDQRPLLRWAMEDCLAKAEQALDELLANFPNRVLGALLRLVVFPFGRRHSGPSDALEAQVAAILGRPEGDPALESILSGVYRPEDDNEPLAALRQAYEAIERSQHAERKLDKALRSGALTLDADAEPVQAATLAGVLTPEEADLLRAARQARRKVIDVDDFAKDEIQLSPGRVR
ncbi:acyl-CoA dehydrogenase [Stutzerimonas urumqiensis]|uniref:acyl-CoA dehydrogenase n=1 Tax=Stutzerimonas urumqiensis TaxID=638269 RepID=UPI003DA585F7